MELQPATQYLDAYYMPVKFFGIITSLELYKSYSAVLRRVILV